MERAAARGTSVHAICAGIAKGNWIPDGMIQDEYIPYVNSFKQWADAQVDKFVIIEKRFTDEDLNYSGQMDFVILGKDNELYLIDLKTSAAPQKTYPIQMAAYESLLKKHHITIKASMIVYLSKTGEFPEIDYHEDLKKEWHIFQCALDCWNYFKKKKPKKVKENERNEICA